MAREAAAPASAFRAPAQKGTDYRDLLYEVEAGADPIVPNGTAR